MDQFLRVSVAPQLVHVEEQTARSATLFIREMIDKIESATFQRAFVSFLLGVCCVLYSWLFHQ